MEKKFLSLQETALAQELFELIKSNNLETVLAKIIEIINYIKMEVL